jgi:hypothetical protein
VAEEGMLDAQRQHFPLNHCAFNVVVFQHHVLPVFWREIQKNAFEKFKSSSSTTAFLFLARNSKGCI